MAEQAQPPALEELQEIDDFLNQNQIADMDIDDQDPAPHQNQELDDDRLHQAAAANNNAQEHARPVPPVPPRQGHNAAPQRQHAAQPAPPGVGRQQQVPLEQAHGEGNRVDNRVAPGPVRRGNRANFHGGAQNGAGGFAHQGNRVNIPGGAQDVAGVPAPADQEVAADVDPNQNNTDEPTRGRRGGKWVQRQRNARQLAQFLGYLSKSGFQF